MKKRIVISIAALFILLAPSLIAEVVINEVFYDPQGTDTGATNREFVEFYNNGPDPVYIGYKLLQIAGPHWKTTNVIMPCTIIPAYSYLLIAEGETFGVTPDLVASLGLQNGNYQAYYDDQWHTFTSPVDGVRLVSGNGATVHDCLLYNDSELGNEHNLETTGAATDGFYEDVPSGYSISRVIAGVDNNFLSDWETLSEPSPTTRGPLYDSDGDGLLDVIENYVGCDPGDTDSDDDGLLDGEEMRSGQLGVGPNETFPLDPDSDDDGLWDGLEVNTYYSKPRKPDTDGDGLEDGPEVNTYGTSPTKPDTDFDGYADNLEVDYDTDPTLALSHPGVVINEVYYDHPGSDDRMEFLNLYNPESYDVDISGFRIESAGTLFQRDCTFPEDSIIPAGCFYMIGEEDALDMNGNPPDLISWLDLQNGDQNDPDAYYYGKESPTDGVRLTGPEMKGVATVIDTVLWEGLNTNDLPGDAHDPAQSDEFIPDVDSGFSIRRKVVGQDTNNKSDWEEVIPLKASSSSGTDVDQDGLTNRQESAAGTDAYYSDSDNDGVSDFDELMHGYNPLDPNSAPISTQTNTRKFPIKSGDFDGDGTPDISIFRPSIGLWAIKGITRVYYGTTGDIPMPADYDGDNTSDITIFRPSSALWASRDVTRVYFGVSTDLPVPGDYDGTGASSIGIFRPSSGLWAIRDLTRVYFGNQTDIPIPADYGGMPLNGDDIAIFRPSTGLWAIRGDTRFYYGQSLDIPVPEKYGPSANLNSSAVFRERAGLWAVRAQDRTYFGTLGDMPIQADWRSDEEIGIFRPSTSLWAIKDVTRVYFGQTNDMPIPMFYRAMDSDCDGLPDWWEEKYFGDLDEDPQGDYDADGSTNLEEYLAGSDPTDQVAYWMMDECAGPSIEDATENDNDGVIHGAEWFHNPSGSGCALSFDGNNDYVEIPNSASLQLDGDLTLSFWLYPNNIGSGRLNPLDKSYGGEFALTMETNGQLHYYHGTNRQSGYYWNWAPFDAGTLVNGKWQFITITRDSSTNTMRSYLNGDPVKTTAYSTDPNKIPSTSNYPVKIARGYTGSGYGGVLDETRIYHRALTPAEISDLYDSDKDTLPDIWEMYYFGNLVAQNAQGNPDGDWCNNIQEYEAGTDPTVRDCGLTPTPTTTPVPTCTPDYIEPVFPPSGSTGDSVPYIIITNEALKNADTYPNFQTLLFHRLAQGMRGGIITVEEIDSQYDGIRPDGGIDLQTKIRQFIKDAYDNWGTEYIVLGGDTTIIPTRYFIRNQGDYFVPADMYYSCLYSAFSEDSDFDNNGNGIYGEPTDGPNGDDVDASPEVHLGRIAVEYPDEIKNSVNKIINYETSSGGFFHKLLFMTAFSFYNDPSRLSMTGLKWGTDSINGFNKQQFFNEFDSVYFDVMGYTTEEEPEKRQFIVDKINEDNNHMIFNESHSNDFYGLQISTIADSGEKPGLGDLTNTNPFLAYDHGCNPGSYDYLVGPGKPLASFGSSPFGVVLGDFNQGGDGHLDVATTFPDDNAIKRGFGNGDGSFSTFQTIANSANGLNGPTWLIKGYFNADSYWDFAVVNSEANSFSVLNSNGSGGYTVATYNLSGNPNHLTTIDFDGDGDSDLAITTVSSSMGIYLYENNNGNFSYYADMELPWDEIEEEATYISSGKFNSDNNTDLVVTSNGDKVYVVFGDGDGTFSGYTSLSVGADPKYVCAGDFNQDGYDDFAVACRGSFINQTGGYNSEIWVWRSDNANPGVFYPRIYLDRNNVNFLSAEADLNQDGYLDLIITEYYPSGTGFGVFLGRPLGKFIPNRGGYGGLHRGRSVVVGDIDEDGFVDIVISKASDNCLYKALSREDACFFEELINMEHGGFAAIAHAYAGGGWEFQYEFVDAITRERIEGLGELYDRSREENIGNFPGLRNLFYYQHLFGDPAVTIKFNEIPFILDNGDFNGDGTSDITVYRSKWDSSESSVWEIKDQTRIYFGIKDDLPASGDYNGDGTTQLAVFRKTGGLWIIKDLTQFSFGTIKDMPAPGDYDGDGATDIAVYRPSEALWSIRNVTSFSFGEHMDIPTILDYNGNGSVDIAAFRPTTGDWLIRGLTTITFGVDGDLPIPADYNGDGTDELAIFRPSDQLWSIKGVSQCSFGSYGDIAAPADYDGDGVADIAVFQPESGTWVIKDQTQYSFGTYIDIPIAAQP